MATLTRTLTYAQLVAEINAGTLNKGEGITISDFATTHNFLDGDSTLAAAPNVATVEPLLVFATSNNTIDCVAKSRLFPKDIIHYDWNPANWLNDRAFSNVDSAGFGLGTIISGFKGVITYREDTIQKNKTYYDFRGVKYRRWALDVPTWSNFETYTRGAWVRNGDFIYRSAVNDNLNHAVFDVSWWVKVLDTSKTVYWAWSSTNMNGCPVNSADYINVPTWVSYIEAGDNVLGLKHNINDEPMISTILPNIVFVEQGNLMGTYNVVSNKFEGGAFYGNSSIGANFYGNSIGTNFYGNSISMDFHSNSIGAYFYNNSIDTDFNSNSIGSYFYYNWVGAYFYSNSTGSYFYNSAIGAFCGNNSIGAGFYYNSMGGSSNNNSIGADFSNNFISSLFFYNSVGARVQYKNLTTVTELFNKTYPHEIIAVDGAGIVIRWYDSTGVLQTLFVA